MQHQIVLCAHPLLNRFDVTLVVLDIDCGLAFCRGQALGNIRQRSDALPKFIEVPDKTKEGFAHLRLLGLGVVPNNRNYVRGLPAYQSYVCLKAVPATHRPQRVDASRAQPSTKVYVCVCVCVCCCVCV